MSISSVGSGVPFSLISPTKCAERIVDELITMADGDLVKRREQLMKLVRQLVRDQYEHCAQTAEDWIVYNDPKGELAADDVADGIAESMRRFAEERLRGDVAERQTR